MSTQKVRIYKYDNVKALLIFLVVIGHMTTDYVSDSFLVRWTTLWIYSFHMPAFIFISGLVHKQYITEEKASLGIRGETRLRWDKILGYFLCAYGLKVFLQVTRTMMGQNPRWHWIAEPGIPWYLFVMAGYELLFYFMRRVDDRVKPVWIVTGAFALSAVVGYFPIIGDEFCLARFINFLPIYMIGYYADMTKFLGFVEKRWAKVVGWIVIAATLAICAFGKWGFYGYRKWCTGRRSYEFMQDFFDYAMDWGWAIRLASWAAALVITFALLAVIPNLDLGFITVMGSRTLNVYFWHRPVCYLFRTLKVLPNLVVMFGGTYDEAVAGVVRGRAFGGGDMPMIAGFLVYLAIGEAMTPFFSLRWFEHPSSDIMALGKKLGDKLTGLGTKERR